MRILLTGCSGFVGKFTLRELCLRCPDSQILCLFRAKKLKVEERWAAFLEDSLFSGVPMDKVSFIEGDLEHLDMISFSSSKVPDVIINSAANVRTMDTYSDLYRDNVIGVQRLCEMAIKLEIPRLLLVSTCYVHPRGTVGKPELLPEGLPKSIFTTDYTYTKYLGEQIASKFSSEQNLKISILRLSCVGAPSNWLDAHPTPGAMAHMGFISMALRGKIQYGRAPSTMSLSTIPVNIVAKGIVDEILTEEVQGTAIVIKQLCANPQSEWNLSIPRICETIQRLSSKTQFEFITNMDESEFNQYLSSKWGFSRFTPSGYKSLRFHEEANKFINSFADGQRFISSLSEDEFPSVLNSTHIYEQTCVYVARGIHQFQLEKGYTTGRLDRFWATMSEHDIQIRVMLKAPLVFKSKEDAWHRFFDCFSAYRPFSVNANQASVKYSSALAPRISWSKEDRKPLGCQLELLGDFTSVKGFNILTHHGIGDGIALFTNLVPRVNSLASDVPSQTIVESSVRSRSLTFTEELQCLVYYLAIIVKLLTETNSNSTMGEKTIEMSKQAFHKEDGKSFTVSLLNKLFPICRSALQKESIVYCVPAAISGPKERGLSMPSNSFVPILLPWSNLNTNGMQEKCLHSKSVKLVCWCLSQLIVASDLFWIRELFMKNIDVTVSSLMAPNSSLSSFESLHFLPPTPSYIPITVGLMTMGSESCVTIKSNLSHMDAKRLMEDLTSK